MGIRALTQEEVDSIKTVVTIANTLLKTARKFINKEFKSNETTLSKKRRSLTKAQRDELINKSTALKVTLTTNAPIKGKPVIVAVDGREIYLNYDLLAKFLKPLSKQGFLCDYKISVPDQSQILTVYYRRGSQHGTLDLYEIPPRQRDLLQGLPRIELEKV